MTSDSVAPRGSVRVRSDDLGVVAFVLPGSPNAEFELHEWPDGSFSLEPVPVVAAAASDAAVLAAARARAAEVRRTA